MQKLDHYPAKLTDSTLLARTAFHGMSFTEIDREDFRRLLAEIHATYIPFGMFGKEKYPPNGVPIFDLPEEYLIWFKQREFPKGRLGELMEHVCEIKECGMDTLFDPMRKANGGRTKLET